MNIEFSNKKRRAFLLVFKPDWGLMLFKLLLVGLIVLGISIKSEKIDIPILLISILLFSLIVIQWFTYYQYLLNYYLANRKSKLIIDLENRIFQKPDLTDHSDNTKFPIERFVLHRHYKSKLPFENPTRLDDKFENWLYQNSSIKRLNRLWYLEIISNNRSVGFITPLMTNLKDISFGNVETVYDKNPKIKNGS